jgi:hypothetical protein
MHAIRQKQSHLPVVTSAEASAAEMVLISHVFDCWRQYLAEHKLFDNLRRYCVDISTHLSSPEFLDVHLSRDELGASQLVRGWTDTRLTDENIS